MGVTYSLSTPAFLLRKSRSKPTHSEAVPTVYNLLEYSKLAWQCVGSQANSHRCRPFLSIIFRIMGGSGPTVN
jgi:hypothetical protein